LPPAPPPPATEPAPADPAPAMVCVNGYFLLI
jgi:hypothetical protein